MASPRGIGRHRLLSEMAAGVSEAEILQMEAAVVGFPIRIISIEAGVSVGSFFRQWAGDFTVESAAGSDEGDSTDHFQSIRVINNVTLTHHYMKPSFTELIAALNANNCDVLLSLPAEIYVCGLSTDDIGLQHMHCQSEKA